MKKTLITVITLLLSVSILTGCSWFGSQNQEDATDSEFTGTTGEVVSIENNEVTIAADEVSDGKAHYFNTQLPDGDTVYFFLVKSPDGNLRAAANGCQVCGNALQGFRQEGDFMVCNTCGNQYPLNKIATEKGGCNPAPINPDLKVADGNVIITQSELEDIKQFFI